MTLMFRIFFVSYIILISSFDTALAGEFEEIGHMLTHDHRVSQADERSETNLSAELESQSKNEKSSSNHCPESEGCHTGHQCHMGHCGYLPPSFVLKNVVQNNDFSTGYHQILQSRTLDSLFKPPRFA